MTPRPMSPRSDIVLRRACLQDASEITGLVRAAYGKWVARIGRAPLPMTIDQARAIAEHEVWVAEAEGGVIAGVLDLALADDHVMVENIAVHPVHQGKGLGMRLLAQAEVRAQEAGLRTIRLYTHEKMTENVAYYRTLGFSVSERRKLDGFRRVFMEKTVAL